MVVRADISTLPSHGRGDYLFNIRSTPGRGETGGRRFQQEKSTFTELWMRGFTQQEIADVLSIDYQTVRNWRSKLDLPNRKPGRYNREKRVTQMAAQITKRIEREGMRPLREIFLSWGVLDEQGRHTNGTDKQTNHNYGDAYDDLFRNYDLNLHGWYSTRDQVKLMMEVGIADGSSLSAWAEAFPNAQCVGMDIHPPSWRERCISTERLEFHLGDQRLREDCERAVGGRQFDFICEDATHNIGNTLLTLYWLWPHVKPGGMYVVEEWDGVAGDKERIWVLFDAEIIDTIGPSGGTEPLVVLRKPLG